MGDIFVGTGNEQLIVLFDAFLRELVFDFERPLIESQSIEGIFPPGKGVSSVKFSCLNLTLFPYNHYYICILFTTLLFSFALHYRLRLPVQNAQKLFKTEKYQLNCLVERNYEKSHNWSSKNDKWKKISAFWSHNLKLEFIRMVILCAQSAFLMYLHNDFLSLRCWLSPIWFSHLFFFVEP